MYMCHLTSFSCHCTETVDHFVYPFYTVYFISFSPPQFISAFSLIMEWVETIEPESGSIIFANLTTGEVLREAPPDAIM